MTQAVSAIWEGEPTGYWASARRPFAGLVFLLPLLVLYEVGAVVLGRVWPGEVRNLADSWMRFHLHKLGLNHSLLLPGLVVVALLAWHLCGRYPWRVRGETLVGMLGESVLFAGLLFGLAQLQWWAFGYWHLPLSLSLSLSLAEAAQVARLVSFVGAGVYEEVLFRLCLLPICWGLLCGIGFSRKSAAVGAMIATSLVFAAAHHVGISGEVFGWYAFTFRAVAGSVFAGLFLVRGFGITVGAHASYDLLVGLLFV